MSRFEDLKKEYREIFKDWSEEKITERARWMAEKYDKIKFGENVIHLEYYHGLLDDTDITDIETRIAKDGLELSRFDKNGVPYNSLQDYTLQISILLATPIVEALLLGTASSSLWDAIKFTSILAWKRIKERHWTTSKTNEKKLNFGLHIQVDTNTSIDMKLDGEFQESTIIEALNKVLPAIRDLKVNEHPKRAKFFIYLDKKKKWKEVDTMKEITRIAQKKLKAKVKPKLPNQEN